MRINLDLYEKRYAVFEAVRLLLVEVVQHDHVDADQILDFKVKTSDAVFLFDNNIKAYLEELLQKVLRFKSLKAQEKAADDYNEEEKAQRLVDLSSAQHQLLNSELETVVGKFLPYMRFRNLS